jgi:hypothetical protein
MTLVRRGSALRLPASTLVKRSRRHVTKIGEIDRLNFVVDVSASANARPLHEKTHEVRQALGAGLVEQVADVSADGVLGHCELVRGLIGRKALQQKRRHGGLSL